MFPKHRMVRFRIGWINFNFGLSPCHTIFLSDNLTTIFRSDFIYMVPPFLAYYGVTTANQTLLEDAYTQISLYRSYQRDTNNLWKHVTLGTNEDLGHWSTGRYRPPFRCISTYLWLAILGNGWAAAGMLRVLGTIAHSQFAGKMKQEQMDLANWVQEIHDGMYANLVCTSYSHPLPVLW